MEDITSDGSSGQDRYRAMDGIWTLEHEETSMCKSLIYKKYNAVMDVMDGWTEQLF